MLDAHERLIASCINELKALTERGYRNPNHLIFIRNFLSHAKFGGFDPIIASSEKDFIRDLHYIVSQLDAYFNVSKGLRSNTRKTLLDLRNQYGDTTSQEFVVRHLEHMVKNYAPVQITRRSLPKGQTFRDVAGVF